MAYAIITVGGKQYRVQEGQTLLVDRVKGDEGATFEPPVLFVGGDGSHDFAPQTTVTARVVGHVLGEKIRIGKYKAKTGYRKHAGYRSRLSRIAIDSIAAEKPKQAASKPKPKPKDEAPAAEQGAPKGYEGLKVTEIAAWAEGKDAAAIDAALAWEREHGARKGAIGALEKAKEGDS